MEHRLIQFCLYNIDNIVTWFSIYFFNLAQPVLLYLIPCTLFFQVHYYLFHKKIINHYINSKKKNGKDEEKEDEK
jgi:hypothetical protein